MRTAALSKVFGCAAAIALSHGCTSETAAVTRASVHAQPHLPAFARFDRWARRVAAGDGVARPDAALSELLFAPARNAPDLIAVVVEFAEPPARTFVLPARSALGPVREWVALRAPGAGAIHAAVEARCPIERLAPSARAAADRPCVLLTNSFADRDQ